MSSAIASLEFDAGVTTCTFHGGYTHTWNNIPKEIFDEWYNSSFWGRYFHENIKGKYD